AGAVRQAGAPGGGGDASVRGGVLPRQGRRRRAPQVHPRDRQAGAHGYMDDFGEKYCDFPRVEGWRHELLGSFVRGMMENLETFRDDYQDSDSIHRAMQEWHLSCVQSSPPSCCSYAESQAAVPAQLVSVNQHND
uniref:Flavin-containing monooxygenase n=1 Tax=Aegilops tauschii subsp. strangulata TaxID=200361 RepID=A0A453ISL4_AEGTS